MATNRFCITADQLRKMFALTGYVNADDPDLFNNICGVLTAAGWKLDGCVWSVTFDDGEIGNSPATALVDAYLSLNDEEDET